MRTYRHMAMVALAALALPSAIRAQADVADELKWRVEQLRDAGTLRVAGREVPSFELTLEVYERRGFLPLWTDPASVESLVRAVAGVRDDGLDPEHYHFSALDNAKDGPRDPASVAEFDLLATDALVRIRRDIRFGKTEPQGPASKQDGAWPASGADAVAQLVEVVASGRVLDAVVALRPQHFVYQGLMRALADLRRIESAGGWEGVPPGPLLGRDSIDARVPVLRRRLMRTGDLRGDVDETNLRYDAEVEAAVKSFQHRHGLNEDGLLGGATVAALNVPVERRIEQVRINLERARWIAHELPDTFVVVNVAGAKAYLLQGDHVAFETRAIVGTRYTRTPTFTAPMLYVDLNPTWTVPPGIVGEILGLVRRDPGYLTTQRIRVLDRGGREIDPAGIDFTGYTAKTFPYVLRQDPGPLNALGRIKLMFPNQYNVYLHDTPSRGLFAREERLFSRGCIRIQDPLGLAELVIGDPNRWNRNTLQAAIDTGETRTIRLARPVPVFVLYWTAAVDLHGELHFYPDVYGRDGAVLAELDTGGTRRSQKR